MTCDDEDDLNEAEIALIAGFKIKAPNGYNLSMGGDGAAGFVRSEEWRAKVSKTLMNHSVSQETRDKIGRKAKQAYENNPQLREIARQGRLGKPSPMLNKKHTEETIAKMKASSWVRRGEVRERDNKGRFTKKD